MSALYPESGPRKSGKPRQNSGPASVFRLAACRLLKCLGMPRSFRNLYIVELALEAETDFSRCGVARAAATIFECAQAARAMGECVNYFWFEDSGWRQPKLSYKQRDEIMLRSKLGCY